MVGKKTFLTCTLLVFCSIHCSVCGITFGARETKGHVKDDDITEISGLAISRVHKNVGYVHNDKGDSSRFFAVNLTSGETLRTFELRHAQNYDWEDIAIGPCADDCVTKKCSVEVKPSRYCLYIADIGDHSGDGAKNIIYMIREPVAFGSDELDVVQTLEFRWTETNAESLMISPDGRLFVISKIHGGQAKMAMLPSSGWGQKTTLDMAQTATLRISTSHKDPQGADIAANGKEMLVVCEDDVYYYRVPDGDFLNSVRNDIPTKISSYRVVSSTEAISWTPEAKGFYVAPEGRHSYFYYYPLVDPAILG